MAKTIACVVLKTSGLNMTITVGMYLMSGTVTFI